MTFLPADFTTAPSLWEQATEALTPEQEAFLLWEPSEEDREWLAREQWDAMMFASEG